MSDHVDQTTTPTRPSPARSWAVLLFAGALEIGYALSVKGSEGFTDLRWSLVAGAFFLVTLFTLSVAITGLDVGMAYAVWTGIGAVGAAAFGPVFFAETLTATKVVWLAVIIAGVVWLKLADSPALARTRPAPQ